ncbi:MULTISPECIES: hypothetical protein [Agriterribacter]|uniref:hypothetical protein n=1 Tax=Agriterribacter TaxID=2821507 RepID=UPI001264D7E9|nr:MULTISPECIES: hypothetical protein [Agriterribacter]HRO47693.1 hypothetical protein [Agriterribacter sp.]HRQ17674.1 hypothetical protein [Agriterribacter sp.]
MDSYKEFIKEVHALDVRTIELQAQKIIVDGVTYTEILPLWELDPTEYKPADRKRLNEEGIFFVQCWDLSHYYDVPNQNIWESGYRQKLKGMQQAAIVDVPNKQHAEVLLNQVNQWLIGFKAFDKLWSVEKMHNYYGRDFYKSTLYYQDDLKIKFLAYFHTKGVAEKKEGYSPSFLYMLHDIYNVKMALLEGLKTQLTAITGTELKRGSTKFIFDDEMGWLQYNNNRATENKNILPKPFELVDKRNVEPIKRLHKALKHKNFINASLPEFKALFGLSEFTNPIVWVSAEATATELLYFYYKLKESNKLKKHIHPYVTLKNFFIKQNGEQITENLKQINQTINTATPKRAKEIDTCFNSWFTS